MNLKIFKKINIEMIIEYGLYLLVFLLSVQTRLFLREGSIAGGYSEYLTISLYGIDILLIIILLLNSYAVNRDRKKFSKINTIWLIIGGLEFIIFVSLFFASDLYLAFYRYGVFLLGVGLFWLVTSSKYNKIKLFVSFLAGIFFQASLGIWQFLAQSTFSCKWLGIASHNPSDLGVSVIETIGFDGIGERWLRAYGGLDHPNIFGGLLVIGLIFLLAQNVKIENYFKKNTKNRILYYLLFFGLIVALFFSFSRTAWLALFISIIIIIALTFIEKNWIKQRNILESIFIGSIIIFFLFTQFSNLVDTRITSDARLENKSNDERIEYLNEAEEIIKEDWLFGAGIGNYINEIKEEKRSAWKYQAVHNVFLLILAEIGVFGLIGFVIFLIYLAFISKINNYLGLPIIFALVIIILFDHWLWSSHFGVLLFWLACGIVFKENDKKF